MRNAVNNLIETKAPTRLAGLLEELPLDFVGRASIAAFEAELRDLEGNEPEAIRLAKLARSELGEAPGAGERSVVCDALASAKQFCDAFAVIRPLVREGRSTPEGEAALHCAVGCGEHGFVLDYCRSLRQAGIWDIALVKLEAGVLMQYHETEKAIALLRESQGKLDDVVSSWPVRLHLSLIGLSYGRPDLVDCDPTSYPPAAEVKPHDGRVIAGVLKRGPDRMKGVKYAYELVTGVLQIQDSPNWATTCS